MAANSDKKGAMLPVVGGRAPWVVQKTNAEYITYLCRAASVSRPFAQVLINRGIKTPGEVSDFVSPSLDNMSDPLGIDGMGPALEAIEAAGKNSTRVLVHGDYDVDGVTATAIMLEALRKLGIETSYYIPNRFRDGYGFNVPAVKQAKEAGIGLIITVDCGISSFEAVEAAKAEGIGVIITDHHEPEPSLPDALSVINPKVGGSAPGDSPQPLPLKGVGSEGRGSIADPLSGAGVALKVAQALAGNHCHGFFDLAALGTLADFVPLIGENRIIAKEGLAAIQEGRRPGIKALKAVSRLGEKQLKAGTIAFTLIPRMNAAGRIDDASEVVELLLSRSEEAAMDIAASLNRKNFERQKIEEDVYNKALAELDRKGVTDPGARPPTTGVIVLGGEGWHEGVIGIVASRIAARFSRPAFIFSIKDGVAKGSARSIPGFDLHAGLTELKDMLLSFGGHKEAAGLKLKALDLSAFEQEINSVVNDRVSDFTPTLQIDAHVELREVNFRLAEELQALEPFGVGNPEPLFGSKGLEVLTPRVVGKNHLKMRLRADSQVIDAIGFNMGELCGMVERAEAVDAAYTAGINEWEGHRTVQLNLKALRESNSG